MFLAICIIGILFIRKKELNEIIDYYSVDFEPTDQQETQEEFQ